MICRLPHGSTRRENPAAYENLLRCEILPGIHRVRGFKGAQLLRRDGEEEVEFLTITLFNSLRDVKEFAGEDYEVAVAARGQEVIVALRRSARPITRSCSARIR